MMIEIRKEFNWLKETIFERQRSFHLDNNLNVQ